MKRLKNTPEKWSGYKEAYTTWWDSLSLEQKQQSKKHFLEIRDYNFTRKNPYPNMYDVENIRVSKLSNKQIYRIWVFKDKSIEKLKQQ